MMSVYRQGFLVVSFFVFNDLYIGESRNHLRVMVNLCFISKSVSFRKLGTSMFGAYMFKILI